MSDMPRVIQAARSGLSAALRVEPEMLYAIDGDNSTPANPEFFTSYTRTDLVDEKDERITALENTNRLLCRDLDEAQRAIEVLRGESIE